MNGNPLEAVLEQLARGDSKAAEAALVEYEPILRMIIRRKLNPSLRAKFDSADVVQSVWADLLRALRDEEREFSSSEHLRAFIVRAAKNRFIDNCRRNNHALEHEQTGIDAVLDAAPATREATPIQWIQAEELWDRMVALCPPQHRELLALKARGCALAEIAEKTGLHESSIRRILYELSSRLGLESK